MDRSTDRGTRLPRSGDVSVVLSGGPRSSIGLNTSSLTAVHGHLPEWPNLYRGMSSYMSTAIGSFDSDRLIELPGYDPACPLCSLARVIVSDAGDTSLTDDMSA